ncbi:MAG: helix-turn-helix domain-containing protein [Prevotellaceae bacterium]|jgi:transcriptional regulator with XRE-family HTH domain|nr:helix-turn-helix domain-containing protein [Prevotellaceae bacterium]
MNNVGLKIRKLREERGISQEFIADKLEISQSSYGRLEKSDSRLTVPRLLEISEVLNVSVSVLFGEKATQIINENKGDNAQANIGTLIQQDKEYIASLKEEIAFLRTLLAKK